MATSLAIGDAQSQQPPLPSPTSQPSHLLVVHNQSGLSGAQTDQVGVEALQGPKGPQGPPGTPATVSCVEGCSGVLPGIQVAGSVILRATFPDGIAYPAEGPNLDASIVVTSGNNPAAVANAMPLAAGNGFVLVLIDRDAVGGAHVLTDEVTGATDYFPEIGVLLDRLAGLSSRVFVLLATQGDILSLTDVATVAAGETKTNLVRLFDILEDMGAPRAIRSLRVGEPFVFAGHKQRGLGNGFFAKGPLEEAAYDLNGDTTPDGRIVEMALVLADDEFLGVPSSESTGGLRIVGGALRLDSDNAAPTVTMTEGNGQVSFDGAAVLVLPQGGLQVGSTDDVVDLGNDALTVGGVITATNQLSTAGTVTVGGGFGAPGATLTGAGDVSVDGTATVGGALIATSGLTVGGGFGSTGVTFSDAGALQVDGLLTLGAGLALGGANITGAGQVAATQVALTAATSSSCATAGQLTYARGDLYVCDGTQLVLVGYGSAPPAAVTLFDINPSTDGGNPSSAGAGGFTFDDNDGDYVVAAGGVPAHYRAIATTEPITTGAVLTSTSTIVFPSSYTWEMVWQSDEYGTGGVCNVRHGPGGTGAGNLHVCTRNPSGEFQNAVDFDEWNGSLPSESLTPGTKYHITYVHEANNGRSIYINGIRRTHSNARSGWWRKYGNLNQTLFIGGHDSDLSATDHPILYFRIRFYPHPLNPAQVMAACESSGFEDGPGGETCGVVP